LSQEQQEEEYEVEEEKWGTKVGVRLWLLTPA
jgi:hypothetical protein